MRALAFGMTAAFATMALACSSSKRSIFGGPGDSTTTTGSSNGNGGSSGTFTTSSGLGGDFSGSGGSGGGDSVGCSADLRYVVDGNGGIIQDCWPNQGCSGGMCVEPCKAAADSKGNVGCEFVVATPYFYSGILPPCFSTFVANNWPRAAKLTISRGGQSFNATQIGRIAQNDPNVAGWAAVPATGVPETKVAVLFLSHDPQSNNAGPLTCPVQPAIPMSGGSAVAGSGLGQAWTIKSDTPISMYDIIPYGGAKSYLPSAELVLPTTAWGTNYIAVLPMDSNTFPQTQPRWGQIVAKEKTQIELLPSTPLPQAGPVPAANANVTTKFSLNAGEYVQWSLNADMTGSIIKSDKPVSFTGGNAYICYKSLTSTGGGCDSAHQMIPPVTAMGFEYVMPPYRERGNTPESIPYRIVGAVAGTKLTYDPAPPSGAPSTIGPGQKADFETTGAFVVKSQDKDHPFFLSQIMTGCNVPGNNGSGDEEYVNILPPAQYLRKYVFFSDPSYPTTNLVFVRVKDTKGFQDVTLDCVGKIGNWKPVGKSGTYEITNVDLIRMNVPNGKCQNGPHVAQSDGRFGIMVWGLDNYSSYGYPAGGSVAPINDVVVLPVPK
jgi:hypothetical protein